MTCKTLYRLRKYTSTEKMEIQNDKEFFRASLYNDKYCIFFTFSLILCIFYKTCVFLLQVFDCWFESGSMPYAYIHYPFENAELFEKNFPGHFVAEGLDQTRGWLVPYLFYPSIFTPARLKEIICQWILHKQCLTICKFV